MCSWIGVVPFLDLPTKIPKALNGMVQQCERNSPTRPDKSTDLKQFTLRRTTVVRVSNAPNRGNDADSELHLRQAKAK